MDVWLVVAGNSCTASIEHCRTHILWDSCCSTFSYFYFHTITSNKTNIGRLHQIAGLELSECVPLHHNYGNSVHLRLSWLCGNVKINFHIKLETSRYTIEIALDAMNATQLDNLENYYLSDTHSDSSSPAIWCSLPIFVLFRMCCSSSKHAILRREKSKDLLARIKDNVPTWSDVFTGEIAVSVS
jgi:hypothetical protein